jgi:hypothetical protein
MLCAFFSCRFNLFISGEGVFECPSWIQILIRDTEDALTYIPQGKQAESM